MKEIWLSVRGYEGRYQISSLGRVRSQRRNKARERILRPVKHKNGYLAVSLWRDNKGVTFHIHSLVADAFIGPRPVGMDVCHIDGNRLHNVASNLRYDTRRGNEADKEIHGTRNCGERHGLSKAKAEDIPVIRHRILVNKERAADVGADFGLSARAVSHIAKRTRWNHIP